MAAEARTTDRYDGVDASALASALGVPHLALYSTVGSTMDEAHALGARGVPAGTLVLSDVQTAGRGTKGRRWSSPPHGIWLTLVMRPDDPQAIEVMSLRVGMAAARALDAFAAEPLRLKWPNDLYVDDRKLAGTLVEARWRGDRPDWVAVGFGVNVTPPTDQPNAAGLDPGTTRVAVLEALVPELRAACDGTGHLTRAELDEFAARDLARGRACIEPVRGRVSGIAETGELLVELADSVARVRTGSLILE